MRDTGSWFGRVLLPLLLAPVRGSAGWSESFADVLARWSGWSPLDQAVSVTIDDCEDDALLDMRLDGVVRGCSSRAAVWPHELLIELDVEIAYNGRFSAVVGWVVATPCLRWHRINRLPMSWAAVRLIAAPSFRDATRNRTIGIGRVQLM